MNRILIRSIVVLFCSACSAFGASSTLDITVEAGRYDRTNVPIRVQIPSGQIGNEKIASVTLKDPDGKTIPAQVTKPDLIGGDGSDFYFILPNLPAGETLRLKAVLSADPPRSAAGFAWHDQPGKSTELHYGDRPILRYHYERLDESTPESRVRTYKVFHHLFSPKGDRIITNGLSDDPNVHSPHHRGIFYGFNRITYDDGKSADTWHCINGAYQEHDAFISSDEGAVLGRHRVSIGWHGNSEKKAFAQEDRELTVYNVPGGHLIEFASRMKTTGGRVRIDGDPQHAGLQFRAHNDVDAYTTQETIYIRPDGVGKPGETRNWDPSTREGPVNMPWNAMSFVLGGKRYTTAYLDRPDNPKEARFSEREYGRFGSYFEYTIDDDKPLVVNYRLWLQEGQMKPEEVAALSHDFVEPVKVTVQAR